MRSTEENLQTAGAGESQTNRKPEGEEKALSKTEKAQTVADKVVYVCQLCGYRVEGEPPERCPICRAPRKMFKLVE